MPPSAFQRQARGPPGRKPTVPPETAAIRHHKTMQAMLAMQAVHTMQAIAGAALDSGGRLRTWLYPYTNNSWTPCLILPPPGHEHLMPSARRGLATRCRMSSATVAVSAISHPASASRRTAAQSGGGPQRRKTTLPWYSSVPYPLRIVLRAPFNEHCMSPRKSCVQGVSSHGRSRSLSFPHQH